MPLSKSILRRYTPPTCTLEIVAKNSPLSRFVGQPVLKDLRFELRFDDPRQPEDQGVTIRGDRTELEMLYEAVNSYVQDFLNSPSTQLTLTSGGRTNTWGSTANENLTQDLPTSPTSSATYTDSIAPQIPNRDSHESAKSASVPMLGANSNVRSLKSPTFPKTIYLEPKGLLAHNLFLGHLATEESGPIVGLSVLQLFDLASALDEYAADVLALPKLNVLSWKRSVPAWASTAAAVVAAVGVTATTMKLLDRPQVQQQAVAPPANQQLSPTPSPLTQVPPLPTAPPGSPLPTPALPPSLSSAPVLPPPSPVTIPPTPATLTPLPTRQRPTISITPSDSTNPADTAKRPAARAIPGTVASRPPVKSPTATSSKRSSSPASPEQAPTQQSKPNTPATPPPLPDLPPLLSDSSSSVANAGGESSLSAPRTTSGGAEANRSQTASGGNSDRNTLFDNIPQVGEVRNYFQKRWQPPSNLTQTLEYRLVLNQNGSIQQIVPLGKAAENYIDRTNMPLLGEPFVSPLDGQGSPRIRVVLTPDGQVQTFLERKN